MKSQLYFFFKSKLQKLKVKWKGAFKNVLEVFSYSIPN